VNGADNVVALLTNSITGFGEMDIIAVFETVGVGSIPTGPANKGE
jgi:hypothetical protein